MDWSAYKFRCSQLGRLMSKSGKLTLEAKAYLAEIYIKEVYGREKDISNKYMEKGLYCEEDSLALSSKKNGQTLVKNKKHFENDYIQGTPDVVLKDKVIDIKTSWDIFTFMKADGTNWDYYWQLMGYCWLTDKNFALLNYCLCNAPEHLIYQEVRSKAYKAGLKDMEDTPEFADMEAEVEKNMKFDDIEESVRVKVFPIFFDENKIRSLMHTIDIAREYLSKLEL